jgi:uncharacterized protein YndB with AHSA1/START domain
MAKVERSIQINAPVEKVYDYLVDPNNLPEIWPSLVEVKDIQRSPGGEVSSYKWTYKMAGMRFEGTTEITELVPNQRLIIKDSGGIQGTRTTTIQPVDDGTRLAVEQEYTVPVPLLGRLAEPFILKQNENEADVFLANLKARMED